MSGTVLAVVVGIGVPAAGSFLMGLIVTMFGGDSGG